MLLFQSCSSKVNKELEKIFRSKNVFRSVLKGLPKAFDSILHDLFIAKMHSYGFLKNSLTFFGSCLRKRLLKHFNSNKTLE